MTLRRREARCGVAQLTRTAPSARNDRTNQMNLLGRQRAETAYHLTWSFTCQTWGHPHNDVVRPIDAIDLVPRPGLATRLAEGLDHALTLISAPAGFGKTTLVSAWHAQFIGPAVVWVSLDEEDNDLIRFWPVSWRRSRAGTPRWAGRHRRSCLPHRPCPRARC